MDVPNNFKNIVTSTDQSMPSAIHTKIADLSLDINMRHAWSLRFSEKSQVLSSDSNFFNAFSISSKSFNVGFLFHLFSLNARTEKPSSLTFSSTYVLRIFSSRLVNT